MTTSTRAEKRKYAVKDENEDKISKLPDDILISIISRLTFEEATVTSAISTRWQHLFKYITHLNFPPFKPTIDDSNKKLVQEKTFPDYVKRINHFLDLHEGGRVKEFRLQMHCLEGATIERWLEFAFSKNTEIININLVYGRNATWDYSIRLPDLVAAKPLSGLRCLKELSLSSIRVDDGDIEPLLSNSPLLENLSIVWSYGLVNVLIVGCSARLKHLDISNAKNLESIEIRDLIYLVSLRCCGFLPHKYAMRLYNVPKFIEFSASPNGEKKIAELLPRIPSCIRDQLQLLKLSILATQLNASSDMLPKLINVKHLELEVKFSPEAYGVFAILPVIEACCLLEILEIKFSWGWDFRSVIRRGILTPEKRKLSPNLKKLKLLGYYGCQLDRKFGMYIVKNAVALEELIVKPLRRDRSEAAVRARQHFQGAVHDSFNLVIT